MLNYLLEHWYWASVISYFVSFVILCIILGVISKLTKSNDSIMDFIEEFAEVAGPLLIFGFLPGFNLLGVIAFLGLGFIFAGEEIKAHRAYTKNELQKMNQFYKTSCCDVLVRLHHVYKYNESLDNKSVKKCVACKKEITFNDLKIYKDDELDKYESKIPYQTILSKKEFNKLGDTISNQKSKTLFEEEEAKYIKLTMESLENNKNK